MEQPTHIHIAISCYSVPTKKIPIEMIKVNPSKMLPICVYLYSACVCVCLCVYYSDKQNYKDFKAKIFCCEDITAKIIIHNHNIDQLYSKAKRYVHVVIVTVKRNCNIEIKFPVS